MEYLENRTFDEIQIGDTANLVRTLTEKDIHVFAIMSGDINPAHVDVEYANSDMFHKIIGHGMWGGALISTVLGTQLPGPGTIYVGQTLRFKRPVAIGDTLTVSVTAAEKKPEKNRITFACECKNQLDEVVMEGQAEVVAPIKKIRRLKVELPQIALRRPNSLFDQYIKQAKAHGPLKAGVIFPVHKKIIQAINLAAKEEMITPVLIGPEGLIKQAAKEAEIDISAYELIHVEQASTAIAKTIELARNDEIGMIIRGGATKEDLLRAISKHDKGLLINHHMSYALVLDVPTYRKPLILSDTLINIDPSLDVKRIITQNAINFSKALGVELPKVAILAGVDTVSNAMRSTVDASALCKMADRGQLQGGILDGPLTFDNIISAEVAKAKGIQSPVIGDADVLIVPNVETGNILSKQLEYLAESRNAGLVLGAKVPVLMSHINDIHLSTASCAFAILHNEFRKKQAEQLF